MTMPQIIGLILTVPFMIVVFGVILAKILWDGTFPSAKDDRDAMLLGAVIMTMALYGIIIMIWTSL